MPLIALSSDWHLHSYQGPMVRTLPDGTNSRLSDILACAEWMTKTAEERGAVAFLHGGDLTHNRKSMANEAWARVAQFMRRMGERIPTFVLEGNHDLSASGDGTSTVGALDGFVTSVPGVRTTVVGRTKVGWLPYCEDPKQVRAAAEKLSRAGAQVLVAHLGLGDPRFADCVPVDYETPGKITVDDLLPDRFKQVFLGHYHTAQELLPNVRYMGSPLQLSFKEAGKAKGFWLYDTDSDEEPEFVENIASPQFHIMSGAEAVAKLAHGEVAKSDFLWVKDATREDAAALSEASGSADMPALRVDRAPVKRDITVRVDPSSPVADQVAQYVRQAAPDESEAERAAIAALGEQLLKETQG